MDESGKRILHLQVEVYEEKLKEVFRNIEAEFKSGGLTKVILLPPTEEGKTLAEALHYVREGGDSSTRPYSVREIIQFGAKLERVLVGYEVKRGEI